MKWIFQLADFDFTIKRIEGKTNFVADALSRNPTPVLDNDLHAIEQDTDIDPFLELEKTLEEARQQNTPDYDGFIEQLLDANTRNKPPTLTSKSGLSKRISPSILKNTKYLYNEDNKKRTLLDHSKNLDTTLKQLTHGNRILRNHFSKL